VTRRRADDRDNEGRLAADAIARRLRDIGMPVPELLPEMARTPGHAEVAARPDPVGSRARALADLDWPARALRAAANADVDRPAVRAIDAWDPSSCAIVLAGPVGTGKTVAAAWWAIGARVAFRFVRAAELVRVGRFDARWETWLGARALCLDDLGAEYADAKGSFASDMDLLVDTFYADARPMIITTNLDAAAFRERYGERVHDRIRDCATWANVDGTTMRGRR
jgi:IstB-like ATP binding protein